MTKPPKPPTSARNGGTDLASALAARDDEFRAAGAAKGRDARAHRRGILVLAMLVLFVGSVIELFTATPDTRPAAVSGSRASVVFSNAGTGTCLNWPPDAPDKPSFVQCRSDHMFEVAKPVDVTNSLGAPCQQDVRDYLGAHYDPNSRFTIAVLSADDAAGTPTAGRNLLCGLQLLGPGGKPIPFKGRLVDLDQSKTWPAGTCLGLDATNRSTDLPVDCATPHGLEVTGVVTLAERFPAAVPSDGDQRTFINEACTRTADGYLAPGTMAKSGLALGYEPIPPASWTAGSRQVSCNIGRPAEQGWVPLTGSVRTQSPADLPPPPVAPPPPPSPEAPPPPVYEEPLIPIGPIPTEPVAPSPSANPTNPTTPTTPTTTGTTPPGPPALGPLPGPATPPSETTSDGPAPGVIDVPGFGPITLPGFGPPEQAPAG